MDTTQTTPDNLADWITTAEAAKLLGVTARRVRQLVDEKELTAQKVGPKFMLVSREGVERLALDRV